MTARSQRRLRVVNDHVHKEICAECGGACCIDSSGLASPEDFGAPDLGIMERKIRASLNTWRWTIALREMIVRPAIQGREGIAAEDLTRGRCTFHGPGPAGCLIFATRPTGCRLLKPDPTHPGENCESEGDMPSAWAPYRDLLMRILDSRFQQSTSERTSR